ncbi:hypothetical protein LXL04_023847 [Taraxacum kok-saghyz]
MLVESCRTCRPRNIVISPSELISNLFFITVSKSLHKISLVDPKMMSSTLFYNTNTQTYDDDQDEIVIPYTFSYLADLIKNYLKCRCYYIWEYISKHLTSLEVEDNKHVKSCLSITYEREKLHKIFHFVLSYPVFIMTSVANTSTTIPTVQQLVYTRIISLVFKLTSDGSKLNCGIIISKIFVKVPKFLVMMKIGISIDSRVKSWFYSTCDPTVLQVTLLLIPGYVEKGFLHSKHIVTISNMLLMHYTILTLQ